MTGPMARVAAARTAISVMSRNRARIAAAESDAAIAHTRLSKAIGDSDREETRTALAAIGDGRAELDVSAAAPTDAEQHLTVYLGSLEGGGTAVGVAGTGDAASFRMNRRDKDRIAAMRRVGWPKTGDGTTAARGLAYDGDGKPLLGGTRKALRRGRAYSAPELWQLWRSDPDIANVSPCGGPDRPDPGGCHQNLPKILPKGYTVYIHVVQDNGGYRMITVRGTGEALL